MAKAIARIATELAKRMYKMMNKLDPESEKMGER